MCREENSEAQDFALVWWSVWERKCVSLLSNYPYEMPTTFIIVDFHKKRVDLLRKTKGFKGGTGLG